jgi:hypothetical protein
VQRSITKANAQYVNANWDLVDALREETVKLEDVDDEDLPEAMREMTLEERREHVEKNAARRTEIQERINKLNAERREFVAAERKKRAADTGEETLDRAMVRALREQAAAKGFESETAEAE